MLPPVLAASIAFGSPNACNLCHTDKSMQWADQKVRQIWKKRDYQAPLVARGKLIDAARNREWKTLPAMLAYLEKPERNQLFAASLVRDQMAILSRRIRKYKMDYLHMVFKFLTEDTDNTAGGGVRLIDAVLSSLDARGANSELALRSARLTSQCIGR